MNGYQLYIVFSAIKDFIEALGETYFEDDEDEPLHNYLTFINMMDLTNEEPVKLVVESFKKYFEANEEGAKHALQLTTIPLVVQIGESEACDITFYLKKDDENISVIKDHLKAICKILQSIEDGVVTAEENFLNEFVATFVKTLDLPALKNTKTADADELIAKCADNFKPNIEKSVDEFQAKNLSIDRIIKLLALKIKDYLIKNEIPSSKKGIDKNLLIEILNIAIKNDFEDLAERRFEILSLLSGSGILTHLPMNALFKLIPQGDAEELGLSALKLD